MKVQRRFQVGDKVIVCSETGSTGPTRVAEGEHDGTLRVEGVDWGSFHEDGTAASGTLKRWLVLVDSPEGRAMLWRDELNRCAAALRRVTAICEQVAERLRPQIEAVVRAVGELEGQHERWKRDHEGGLK